MPPLLYESVADRFIAPSIYQVTARAAALNAPAAFASWLPSSPEDDADICRCRRLGQPAARRAFSASARREMSAPTPPRYLGRGAGELSHLYAISPQRVTAHALMLARRSPARD